MRQTTNTVHVALVLQMARKLFFSAFTCLFSFQVTNNLKENKRTWINRDHVNNLFNTQSYYNMNRGDKIFIFSHTFAPHGPQATPPPTHLGQEEDRRAPVQSLADLEEAIPNSRETSLAEVSHAPPSATRMAPVT